MYGFLFRVEIRIVEEWFRLEGIGEIWELSVVYIFVWDFGRENKYLRGIGIWKKLGFCWCWDFNVSFLVLIIYYDIIKC